MPDPASQTDTRSSGLSSPEVAARLARDGYNEQRAGGKRSWLRIAAEVLREPLFALLLAAAVLYLVLGDRQEALMLLGFALISVSIAVVQQGRSERMLEALRKLASPQALVIRAGQRHQIAAREVVVDDLMVLTEGDRIVADARLTGGDSLLLDESLLTGESVPVQKSATRSERVYAGTLVQRGTAVAQVTATGARSELGRIGESLGQIRTATPRLQRETRRWVLFFAVGGIGVSVLVLVLYGLTRGDWLQALLAGIALSMSMLPEEIPLVLMVFTVMGAWRLSRSQVLTRRAAAIETLGAATVLCTDKTGTLTRNRMQLAELRSGNRRWRQDQAVAAVAADATFAAVAVVAAGGARGPVPPEFVSLLSVAVAASESTALDPMDRAVIELAHAQPGAAAPQRTLVRHFPLLPDRPLTARLWQGAGGEAQLLAIKGAPEAVAQLCRLDADAHDEMIRQVDEMARSGMRVLAVASAELPNASHPTDLAALAPRLHGLLGFFDPLRDGVPAAVRECQSAGVRVLLITGDYPRTAEAIAEQAGITPTAAIGGEQLRLLDAQALREAVGRHRVFARITPAEKLRIVQALQANGEVVAMTGDGVNDAPALKAADIGIAMGMRGTEVARAAAALVLLDDNFSSIVAAIRLGRRIYDNLRKALGYILALHVPIAGLAILPILTGAPLVLTPVLIALLEMIIDPTCSIALEAQPAEPDVMRRPPRPGSQRMLDWALVGRSAAQGMAGWALVAAVFVLARRSGVATDGVRAMCFVAIVAVILALLASQRVFGNALHGSRQRVNKVLWLMMTVVVAIMLCLMGSDALRRALRLGALSSSQLMLSLSAGLLLLPLIEAGKWLLKRRRR